MATTTNVPHKGYDCIIDGLVYLGPECHAQTCMKDHFGKVTRIIRCKSEGYDNSTYLVTRAFEPAAIAREGKGSREASEQEEGQKEDMDENGSKKDVKDQEEESRCQEQEEAEDNTNCDIDGIDSTSRSNATDTTGPLQHGLYTWQPQVLHLPMTEGGKRSEVLEIERYLPLVFQFIAEAELAKEAVYIHCAAGVNRSATITTAYVMHRHHCYMSKALEFVQSKRRVVCPDKKYLVQLEELEERMFAEMETLVEREDRKRRCKFDHHAQALTQLRCVAPDRPDEELTQMLVRNNWDVGASASQLFSW